MHTVKTNVILHAPVIGLDLTNLKATIDAAIKSHIGPDSSYYFDSNVVIDIPTSCQPVRVFPPNSKDTATQSPRSEVALYTLVNISYEYCSSMVNDEDKFTFYLTAPGGVLDAVQTSISKICSGIRVGIGSVKFAWDTYYKMPEAASFSDFDNRIRFTMEKHLDTLLPLLRSKL